jgi:hypothetical protein
MGVHSPFLSGLSEGERADIIGILSESQNGKCFICEEEINLELYEPELDHKQPLATGGKDDKGNLALTHSSCNRAKQAKNLEVARSLAQFKKLREKISEEENRIPDLDDVLKTKVKESLGIKLDIVNGIVNYSFPEIDDSIIFQAQLFTDVLSKDKYFFAKIPIQYLHHDKKMNPRPIGGSLTGLATEFHKGNPQLHVALGHIELDKNKYGKIQVFDGQHKAAAQVLLGVTELPVRIFVGSDLKKLLETNTNAGTSLKQVAFAMDVIRHLNSRLLIDRIEVYQKENLLDENTFSFSEKQLVNYFKEAKQMRKYILDSQKDKIKTNNDNLLIPFVEMSGRKTDKPLSYNAINRTFFSFFISKDLLETNIDHKLDVQENPRELEEKQIVKLMNIIAEKILVGKFSTSIGTKIESKIQKGEQIPQDHLIAYRLVREEILYVWLEFIRDIIKNYFITAGTPFDEKKLFQEKFEPQLWTNVETFISNLKKMPVWVNKELSSTFVKQNADYWRTIFKTGKSPTGHQVLLAPINIMEMIRP